MPSSLLVPLVWHQFTPTKAQPRALANDPGMGAPALFPGAVRAGLLPALSGEGETAAGRGKQLTQHTQQTGAGPSTPWARRREPGTAKTGASAALPESQGLGASSLEGCAGSRPSSGEHPEVPTEGTSWGSTSLAEPLQAARGCRLGGPGDLSSPMTPLQLPSMGQHPGSHPFPSCQQWDEFVPGISHVWAPCPDTVPAGHLERH